MFVGMPPKLMEFEVRFDIADLVIYRDQSVHSGKHTRGARGPGGHGDLATDAVFFGAVEIRARILDRTRGAPGDLLSPLLCGHCDGILGLRRDADVWQWWPDAAFTPGAITFGGRANTLASESPHEEHTFHCEEHATNSDSALCVIQIKCHDQVFRARIVPSDAYIAVPEDVLSSYLVGKNIYVAHKKWEPLDLGLLSSDGTEVPLSLEHDDLSGQHGNEARELLIVQSERNDTITIGSALAWRYSMYINQVEGTLVIRRHVVAEHLPALFAILFLVASGLILRFKMVSSVLHYDRPPRDATIDGVNIAFSALGWIIVIVLLVLPQTRAVLTPDYTALYIITIGIVVIGISVSIGVRVYVAQLQKAGSDTVTTTMYHMLLGEAIWHEAVLFIALWLAVAPRRREGIASWLTAFAGAWALYTFTSHVVYWMSYVASRFGTPPRRRTTAVATATATAATRVKRVKRPSPWLVAATGVSLVGILVYFGILFGHFFMFPLLERVGMIYAELALGTTLVTTVMLIAAGTEIATLHVQRSVAINARNRLEFIARTLVET